jgi:hypothetical protein
MRARKGFWGDSRRVAMSKDLLTPFGHACCDDSVILITVAAHVRVEAETDGINET